MSEHIRFEKLELDRLPDEAHLAQCEACRSTWEAVRFLRLQLQAVPRIDASPFFAARVARRAQDVRPSVVLLFERVARRLVPVFLGLVIVISLLLMNLLPSASSPEPRFEVLFQQPAQPDVSVEYVVHSLQEPSRESE